MLDIILRLSGDLGVILIHLYLVDYKALYDLNVPLSSQFECSVTRQGDISVRRRRSWVDFYEGYQCHALIGPNGSGKSSILEAISAFDGLDESQLIAIFYSAEEDRCVIALGNVSSDCFRVQYADIEFSWADGISGFIGESKLEFVHVNSISVSYPDFGRARKPKASTSIRQLTVGEAMRTQVSRRRYFRRYLNYFSNYRREAYQDNIRFMFSFQKSSVGALRNSALQYGRKSPAPLLKSWVSEFASRTTVLLDPLSSDVVDALIEMNVPSILFDISKKLPNIGDLHFSLMSEYVLLGSEKSDIKTLPQLLSSVANVSRRLRLSHSEEKDAEVEIARFEREACAQIAEVVSVLDRVAEILYESNSSERFDFSGIVVEDFNVVEILTRLARGLSDAVAGNIQWGWRGASTGELARAHVFSEIFNYLMDVDEQVTPIIFIDEADLYLHPEWQRHLLNDVLELFRHVGSRRQSKPPQLILCTHSPIVISDFLADDIVSLRKNEDGSMACERSSGFGSSIVDIYMTDMHLESTFGEHARIKLAGLLKRCEARELDDMDHRLIEKISNGSLKRLMLSYE